MSASCASTSSGMPRPRRRALLVGCNYPMRTQCLHGACADAFWLANTLQEVYPGSFDTRESIRILHDHDVKSQKRGAWNPDAATLSTRANILSSLRWLVQDARCGDVLLFYYSGFGVLVDDLAGFEGEGYQEAIYPTDPAGDDALLPLSEVHDIVTNLPPGVHMSCFFDCDHATTLVDPICGRVAGSIESSIAGDGPWTRKQALCGLVNVGYAEERVREAVHDKHVWHNDHCRRNLQRVKEKYLKPTAVDLSQLRQRNLTRPAMRRTAPMVFSYSAAGFGQTALELHFPELNRVHGVFTYCLIRALEKKKRNSRLAASAQACSATSSSTDHVPMEACSRSVSRSERNLCLISCSAGNGQIRGEEPVGAFDESQLTKPEGDKSDDHSEDVPWIAVSHTELLRLMRLELREVKERLIPSIDQDVQLTCTRPWCDEGRFLLLERIVPEMLPVDLPDEMRRQLLRFFPGGSKHGSKAKASKTRTIDTNEGVQPIEGRSAPSSWGDWLWSVVVGSETKREASSASTDAALGVVGDTVRPGEGENGKSSQATITEDVETACVSSSESKASSSSADCMDSARVEIPDEGVGNNIFFAAGKPSVLPATFFPDINPTTAGSYPSLISTATPGSNTSMTQVTPPWHQPTMMEASQSRSQQVVNTGGVFGLRPPIAPLSSFVTPGGSFAASSRMSSSARTTTSGGLHQTAVVQTLQAPPVRLVPNSSRSSSHSSFGGGHLSVGLHPPSYAAPGLLTTGKTFRSRPPSGTHTPAFPN
ncbi:unnamed protein product [Amoebophrya sp. A25]|nr:unnamed protein product [Amoebophrya sp. A25]|eukprot:GSA25T00023588001.1